MEKTKNTNTELKALVLIEKIDKYVQTTAANDTQDDSGNAEQSTVVEIGDIEDINVEGICERCAGCTSSD